MDSAKIERGASTATVEMTVIEVSYGIDTSLVERGCGAAIFSRVDGSVSVRWVDGLVKSKKMSSSDRQPLKRFFCSRHRPG
eukprot:scaffold2718_cov141-Skeletonema_menzelii.AAC.7